MLQKVPPGDWFCSDCRPKEPRPSPRKNRRRTFSEVSDEESDHDALSLEETLQEARLVESFVVLSARQSMQLKFFPGQAWSSIRAISVECEQLISRCYHWDRAAPN